MEDFIFDDDVDEVGAEIEAHCPKCKADTAHVVISKYEDEIRRVQCNPCGDVHPFRKPQGDVVDEDEPPAPVKKKAVKAKPTWDQVMAKSKKPPRPYALADYFKEMEVISHPKFGIGYVTETIGDDKIEVTFQNDKRVLVHNRKGLTLPFSTVQAAQKAKARRAPAPETAKPAAKSKPAVKPAARAKASAKPAAKPVKKVKTTSRAAASARSKPAKPKAAAKKVKKSR